MTGHMVGMDSLSEVGLGDVKERLSDLIHKFWDLKFDNNDFTCLKFLILLNPGRKSYPYTVYPSVFT